MKNVEEMKDTEKKPGTVGDKGDDYSLGMAFYRTEMLEEALEKFKKSLKHPDTAEGSLFYLGMIYFQKGEYQRASRHFKDLLEKSPDNLVVYNNLAVSLEREEMFKEAELVYKEAQKISPLASQVLANVGILMYRRGEYEGAQEYLERAVHLNHNMAFAYFYLGMTYLNLSMWDEAEECLKNSLLLSQDNPVLFNNLGIIYKKAGDFQKALNCSLRAVEVDPGLASPYINIDDIFCIIGEWGECEKLFDEVIPERKRLVKLLDMLGEHYHSRKDFELAQKMWQRVLEIEPKNKDIKKKIKKMNREDVEK
jgi:tetratricopeptide (TPR) repeat protein